MSTKAKQTPGQCRLCGHPEYVDPANGESYGYCVPCIIGAFGQIKDHNLIFEARHLLEACKGMLVAFKDVSQELYRHRKQNVRRDFSVMNAEAYATKVVAQAEGR